MKALKEEKEDLIETRNKIKGTGSNNEEEVLRKRIDDANRRARGILSDAEKRQDIDRGNPNLDIFLCVHRYEINVRCF